jgi:hypothetical protein
MHKKKALAYTVARAHHLMELGWSMPGDTIDNGCNKPKLK